MIVILLFLCIYCSVAICQLVINMMMMMMMMMDTQEYSLLASFLQHKISTWTELKLFANVVKTSNQ